MFIVALIPTAMQTTARILAMLGEPNIEPPAKYRAKSEAAAPKQSIVIICWAIFSERSVLESVPILTQIMNEPAQVIVDNPSNNSTKVMALRERFSTSTTRGFKRGDRANQHE